MNLDFEIIASVGPKKFSQVDGYEVDDEYFVLCLKINTKGLCKVLEKSRLSLEAF